MINLYDDRIQIILGSLLGNGFICGKSDYFSMKHSLEHEDWLKVKSAELTEFASKKPFYQYKNTLTWRSKCDNVFAELRELCYKDRLKTVNMKWLDTLRGIAIACWWGDSGVMTGRGNKNACLRTQSFGHEGNSIIEKYFNEVQIPCAINKSRKSYVIVFSIEGTKRLFSIIQASLPAQHLNIKKEPFNSDKESRVEISN